MKGLAHLILLPLVAAGPLGKINVLWACRAALLTPGLDRRQLPSGDKLAELIKSGKLGGAAGKGLGALMGKAQPTKASKVEFIEPKIRPDAKRIRLTYGPYKLRAVNVSVAGAGMVKY
jgi:hypothetical protein